MRRKRKKWTPPHGEEVVIKPTYAFQHQVTYKSEEHKWDGEEKKEEFDMHFSNGSSEIAMGMDMEEKEVKGRLLMVFDLSTMGMANFITTDTMKACMRMRIPGKEDVFKTTGKKRTIAGREAKEWLSTGDGDEVRLWIAEAGDADLTEAFKAFGKVNGKPALYEGEFGKGLVLAGSFTRNDEKKPFYTFEATNVKLDTPFTFKSEGYQVVM
jgi:hypothetical protein